MRRFLPLGINLQDEPCLVVGGGEVGTRKANNLLQAGAKVTVVSPEATPEISEAAESGTLEWIREEFRPAHTQGVFLVVAATDDPAVNREAVVAAQSSGATLACDASSRKDTKVIFGALHEEEGTTVAVFSDGESPGRARAVRDRIAALLSRSSAESGPRGRNGAGEDRERGGGDPDQPMDSGGSCLVLLAHGSRDPRWRGSLENLLASVRPTAGEADAQMAYIQFTGPTLGDVVADRRAAGVRRFRVLPLFMASAGHVEKDVLPLVEEVRASFPDVVLEVLTTIGEYPPFHRLISDIARKTQD